MNMESDKMSELKKVKLSEIDINKLLIPKGEKK